MVFNLKPISVAQIYTASGIVSSNIYLIDILINGKTYKVQVPEIDNIGMALIGMDIVSNDNFIPDFIGIFFEQTAFLLKLIPSFKKSVVLIIGQDTSNMDRLQIIKAELKILGYEGIIVKETEDVELQTVEEKMTTFGSLSRFVICENSIPSGHIDELKICASNRFTTIIIQEAGKGGTYMQADYSIDYTFIKQFNYNSVSDLPNIIKTGVDWAESNIEDKTIKLNDLYPWRK